jgi:flavin reductase (DIM6/NTAB) family NADH-FMN oxidoreductase RutF
MSERIGPSGLRSTATRDEGVGTADDSAGWVDPRRLRRFVGSFPRPVCLLSSRWCGLDHVVTASTFGLVSFTSATVCVSVHRASRLTAMMMRSRVWGISLLTEHDRALAAYFARTGRPLGEGMAAYPARRGPVTGVLLVPDAVAVLECRTIREFDAEDHVIFLGGPVWLGEGEADAPPLCEFRGALTGPPD